MMEAYKARARIWNISWEGHEIRFEFLKGTIWDYYEGPRFLVFFDGKRIATFNNYHEHVSAMVENENGNSYLIECGLYSKGSHRIQWPLSKFFFGRISDWIDKLFTSCECCAHISVNEELIYLSHIGGVDKIELVCIQQDFDRIAKEERALAKGKIMTSSSSGYHKEKASKERIGKTKINLANRRKELESRLSTWNSKNKKANQKTSKNNK